MCLNTTLYACGTDHLEVVTLDTNVSKTPSLNTKCYKSPSLDIGCKHPKSPSLDINIPRLMMHEHMTHYAHVQQ